MGGSPAEYDPMHIAFHEWMLYGTTDASYPITSNSIADLVGDLVTLSPNPYADSSNSPYDATASGQALDGTVPDAVDALSSFLSFAGALVAHSSKYSTGLSSANSVVVATPSYTPITVDAVGAAYTVDDADIDSMLASGTAVDITAAVAAYEDSARAGFLNRLGAFNQRMAILNSTLSTTYVSGQAFLEADFTKDVNAFREKLTVETYLEQQKQQPQLASVKQGFEALKADTAIKYEQLEADRERIEIENGRTAMEAEAAMANVQLGKVDAATKIAAGAMEMDKITTTARVNHMNDLFRLVVLHMQAKRVFWTDNLQMDIESALWDVKAYQYAGEGLSSISGAKILPEQKDPRLEALSMMFSGLAAVGAVFA